MLNLQSDGEMQDPYMENSGEDGNILIMTKEPLLK